MKTQRILIAALFSALACNLNAQNATPDTNLTYEDAKRILPLPYPKASNALRAQIYETYGNKPLQPALKAFFGNNQGRYIDLSDYEISASEKMSLYYQFSQTLYSITGSYRLPTGNLLYWGAQPKEWHNNGFIVTLGNSTQILATALLHQNCGKNNDLKPKEQIRLPNCDVSPTLTIFYSTKFSPSVEINDQITKLVQRHIEINNRVAPQYRTPIENLKVEVRVLENK